jgi:hypothetical protein
VNAVLLYGCTTWERINNAENHLQVYINRCLRKILNVKWPNTITNAELWNTTRQISTVEQIIKNKKIK